MIGSSGEWYSRPLLYRWPLREKLVRHPSSMFRTLKQVRRAIRGENPSSPPCYEARLFGSVRVELAGYGTSYDWVFEGVIECSEEHELFALRSTCDATIPPLLHARLFEMRYGRGHGEEGPDAMVLWLNRPFLIRIDWPSLPPLTRAMQEARVRHSTPRMKPRPRRPPVVSPGSPMLPDVPVAC